MAQPEELRAKGYMSGDGTVHGDPVGPLEGFNIGISTLNQLKRAGLIPDRTYKSGTRRPDGLVIDRRSGSPDVRLVVEHKGRGELATQRAREAIYDKVASEYCVQLQCEIAVITDGVDSYWIYVDTAACEWALIHREDTYRLDTEANLATPDGRDLIAATLERLRAELDVTTGELVPIEAVNPTRLAEQTWQSIWLASGESPEVCLTTFVEILLFKFLSDLGILDQDPTGVPINFTHVRELPRDQALKHYYERVRPEVKRLFPEGPDGTTVIDGLVLEPNNVDHGRLFLQILQRFHSFGTLRRIDPEFKSRIFERFLKKNISKKNWGQYFTPRNVVKAMVEMSGVDKLVPGSVVADPAAGPGGFILEPLVHKRARDFRDQRVTPLAYRGYDRDPQTVVLAKANMLIHLSDLLEADPSGALATLGPTISDTFRSTHQSITGSLSLMPREEWDLVMTNPPYVVAGTSSQRKAIQADAAMSAYYDVSGSGVESLFLTMIIKGLKPGGRALVVLPDGILLRHHTEPLRRYLLETCDLEAIVSLPVDTFYTTPKKTYILSFRKKDAPGAVQEDPVFCYLVGAVGETLDAKRFPTPDENDLPQMATQFRLFQGNPAAYEPPGDDARVRIFPIERFEPEVHWLVDRWWPQEILETLPEFTVDETISPPQLAERLRDTAQTITELAEVLDEQVFDVTVGDVRTVSIGDGKRFRLSIGKRVLKKELFGKADGPVPLYSANVTEPFGHIETSNLKDFVHPSVIFGVDGDFELAVKEAGVEFAITDHCGRLEILDPDLDPNYCRAAIALARAEAFDRTLRPSLTRMRALEIEVPVDDEGNFDLDAQRAIASVYDSVVDTVAEAAAAFQSLSGLKPDVLMPEQNNETKEQAEHKKESA